MDKKIQKQAVEKLEDLGYGKQEINRMMPKGGVGLYGLASGTPAQKIMDMTPDEIERLLNQLAAL